MSLASADLPSDPDALRAFALACQSELAATTAELQAAKLAVQLRTLEIGKLKFQIAKLRRMQFGRSSERLTRQIEQLELRLEELEASEAEEISKAAAEDRPLPIHEGTRPKRNKLPDELPRQEVVHEPDHDGACTCPACGGDMAPLGEEVTEVLDYVPGRFRVIRHVRPKYACRRCDAITQAPAPALPTPRGRAAPGMLATSFDRLPVHRSESPTGYSWAGCSPAEPASASPVTNNSSSISTQRGNQMRCSTSLLGCSPSRARRAPPPTGVSSLLCTPGDISILRRHQLCPPFRDGTRSAI
jgi:hypothetical protein